MPKNDTATTLSTMFAVWRLLLTSERGLKTSEIAEALNLPDRTVRDWLLRLNADRDGLYYSLTPSVDDLAIADAIYRAGEIGVHHNGSITKRCQTCDETFETASVHQRYCNIDCKRSRANHTHYERHHAS